MSLKKQQERLVAAVGELLSVDPPSVAYLDTYLAAQALGCQKEAGANLLRMMTGKDHSVTDLGEAGLQLACVKSGEDRHFVLTYNRIAVRTVQALELALRNNPRIIGRITNTIMAQ